MADGPLQNLASIQVTVDLNGSLVVFAKSGGATSAPMNFLNGQGRCEANNQLVVVIK